MEVTFQYRQDFLETVLVQTFNDHRANPLARCQVFHPGIPLTLGQHPHQHDAADGVDMQLPALNPFVRGIDQTALRG